MIVFCDSTNGYYVAGMDDKVYRPLTSRVSEMLAFAILNKLTAGVPLPTEYRQYMRCPENWDFESEEDKRVGLVAGSVTQTLIDILSEPIVAEDMEIRASNLRLYNLIRRELKKRGRYQASLDHAEGK